MTCFKITCILLVLTVATYGFPQNYDAKKANEEDHHRHGGGSEQEVPEGFASRQDGSVSGQLEDGDFGSFLPIPEEFDSGKLKHTEYDSRSGNEVVDSGTLKAEEFNQDHPGFLGYVPGQSEPKIFSPSQFSPERYDLSDKEINDALSGTGLFHPGPLETEKLGARLFENDVSSFGAFNPEESNFPSFKSQNEGLGPGTFDPNEFDHDFTGPGFGPFQFSQFVPGKYSSTDKDIDSGLSGIEIFYPDPLQAVEYGARRFRFEGSSAMFMPERFGPRLFQPRTFDSRLYNSYGLNYNNIHRDFSDHFSQNNIGHKNYARKHLILPLGQFELTYLGFGHNEASRFDHNIHEHPGRRQGVFSRENWFDQGLNHILHLDDHRRGIRHPKIKLIEIEY